MAKPQASWKDVLALDSTRKVIGGRPEDLRAALGRGADLRIYSEFRHNEHIDVRSASNELIRETMDMRATFLVDGRWAAGAITLRQPVNLPDEFGPRPSLSLFLYNEDGQQAIARPFLDGAPIPPAIGQSPPVDHSAMPKFHELDRWDDNSNAPSSNFIYDFDVFRYFVRDEWTEALHHDAHGKVLSGSVAALADAFAQGAEIKVGIRDLCYDLAKPGQALTHEVFIQAGSCYYYTEQALLIAAAHPLVRITPAIPLRYHSRGWDYGWLLARTDGHVARLLFDPYTLVYSRSTVRHEIRWFWR